MMSVQFLQQDKETIAAIATPVGEGGIGIIRVSGSNALEILKRMFRPHHPQDQWRSHKLVFGQCEDESGELIDEVLAAWMAAGHSYTGEEVVEIHAHGGRLNMLQLLRKVFSYGARPAQAGEFTRRAFLNGRIDLTRAEAIADLISANNEQALRIARSHLKGRLQEHLDTLADNSLLLAAQVESWLDFPEEFDPALDESVARILEDIGRFREQVRALLQSYETGRRLQRGWSFTLLGRPNAGKSSLFNSLSGEDRAIVTSLPGTTRDLLETQIALGGLELTLTDTAGIRRHEAEKKEREGQLPSHDEIEQMGVNRALKAAAQAHLLLAVLDRSRAWSEEDQQVLEACQGRPTLLVLNKCDLPEVLDVEKKCKQFAPLHTLKLSCATGEGLTELRTWLEEHISQQTPSQELLITNERQRDALARAMEHLDSSMSRGVELGPEFLAEDLRASRQALAQITGQVSSEDILETIFTRFCIGK